MIDKDHITPKALFPKPRPKTMITVPSCKTCHSGTGLEDTYLRDVLVLREDVSAHDVGRKLTATVVKDLKRKERTRSLDKIRSGYKQVDLTTPAGIYVGSRPTIDVDSSRLDNETRRIVRGLIFHETQQTLPHGYRILVFTDVFSHPEIQRSTVPDIFNALPVKSAGERVFSYRNHFRGQESFWFLSFYETVHYLVAIESEERKMVKPINKVNVAVGSPYGFVRRRK